MGDTESKVRRTGLSATPDEGSAVATTPSGSGRTRQGAWLRHGVASFGAGLIDALRAEERQGQAVLWLPVAMALGAACWFSADKTILLLPVAFLFAATAAGCLLLSEKPRMRVTALFAAGFLAAMLAAQLETARRDTILLDSDVTTRIRGTVIGRDIDYRGLWRYTIDLHQTFEPEIGRSPQRVRLIARSRHQPIRPGDGIAGLARLQPPSGPALPGGYDFAFYAFFNGLGAYGFFLGAPAPIPDDAAPVSQASMTQTIGLQLARIREGITLRIRAVLSGDTAGFASALTVADRRAMSPATVEALRESGLAHVLAISGLHMALVSGTLFFFLRVCFSFFPSLVQAFPVKKIAAAAALLVATFYLLISGASISTQRAWIMLAIMLVAVILDRPALTMRNVALAAIIIILVTPSAVMGPGFQMSFAATIALIATYAHWNRQAGAGLSAVGSGWKYAPASGLLRLIVVFLFGLAMTSLVAGLATAPFATYHFYRVASLGLLANLAAMPIVTFIVMPAGLIALLAMPLGFETWPLLVMGQGLEWVIAIAHFVQGLGGVIIVGRVPGFQFASLVAGFLILALVRTRIRLTGAAVLLAGLLAPGFAIGPGEPELVVSEDGRLIAFVHENALATNRSRPSKFIFQQWQGALGRAEQIKPVPIPDPERSLEDTVSAITWNGKAVTCVKSAFCTGLTRSGHRVMIVEDLLYLGAACDRADIVITAAKINMERCYSGAMLMTGRMLRQSGAVEIYANNDTGALTVRSSVGHTQRPWTAHRSYDWRSRTHVRNAPDWLNK